MDLLGYINEITRVRFYPSRIDAIDEHLLSNILKGDTSVYKLYSKLKEERHPMAYKNVHRRIKKLFESNLIEEIKAEDGFKHGARNYKVATRGLIYLFSQAYVPHEKSIFLSYSENVLFRTFVYPYFERRTIKSATYGLYRLIRNYLEQACQTTRYALERIAAFLTEYPSFKSTELMLELGPIQILQYQLNWHIKSFILKLAVITEDLIDWRNYNLQPIEDHPLRGKIRCVANDREYTFALLSSDKKFMKALERIEGQVREGYDTLIELKDKKTR
jgi:hypothetical protein